jgi:hypothetical protein
LPSYHLAQLNIARLCASIDSPQLADFVAGLERINALADRAPGFLWRMQSEQGDAAARDRFGADVVANLSVWEGIEPLWDFVYRSAHAEVMRRRREWFQRMPEAYMVLWWMPSGHVPTVQEADARLRRLREHGPDAAAFTFKRPFPAPDVAAAPTMDRLDDACRAT